MTIAYLISNFATLIALIFAITSSVAAKGMVATKFGDYTARTEKRLTFNPLVHIDLMGTIILPAILLFTQTPFIIGWPKPLHLNYSQLRPHRLGNIAVSLSGLLIHIFIAWFSLILIHLNPNADTLGNEILVNSFRINLMFTVFSLIPLPPLEGGRIVSNLLPPAWAESYLKVEPYTPMIIMLLFLLPNALGTIGIHFHPLMTILMPLLNALQKFILFLSGHLS